MRRAHVRAAEDAGAARVGRSGRHAGSALGGRDALVLRRGGHVTCGWTFFRFSFGFDVLCSIWWLTEVVVLNALVLDGKLKGARFKIMIEAEDLVTTRRRERIQIVAGPFGREDGERARGTSRRNSGLQREHSSQISNKRAERGPHTLKLTVCNQRPTRHVMDMDHRESIRARAVSSAVQRSGATIARSRNGDQVGLVFDMCVPLDYSQRAVSYELHTSLRKKCT